ncbi:uncharacterized protein B0I36DRAFT_312212 [Microdochium trichocladiopsis]|uniref:Uncharacterized protein n=1 Tax=Microdochium trichocladiopsis TaxID=1682393 RepID=A0A9P8YIJ4_9PEZI|nr:uncharacterized protein B0I36DRAFT_312212 [Microdochium trichocladiopsis]KAH7041136.1 hypothetical protein B0I36DRAFT_312212 [Microdochium trichocladiopsis]
MQAFQPSSSLSQQHAPKWTVWTLQPSRPYSGMTADTHTHAYTTPPLPFPESRSMHEARLSRLDSHRSTDGQGSQPVKKGVCACVGEREEGGETVNSSAPPPSFHPLPFLPLPNSPMWLGHRWESGQKWHRPNSRPFKLLPCARESEKEGIQNAGCPLDVATQMQQLQDAVSEAPTHILNHTAV